MELLRDELNPSDIRKFPHDITHGPDALRYFLVNVITAPEEEFLYKKSENEFYFKKKEEELFIDEELIDSFYD